MKGILLTFINIPLLLFGVASPVYVQGANDYSKLATGDYINTSLPSLDLLFENAEGGPIYGLAGAKRQVERRLLAEEGCAFSKFFNTQGGYQQGKVEVDSTFTDVSTPVMYNYNTSRQTIYAIGGIVSVPFDGLFDLVPRVKRQKLGVKAAALEQEAKFEEMKWEIIEMYAAVTFRLDVLKLWAEALKLTTMQYDVTGKDSVNNTVNIGDLPVEKQRQPAALEASRKSKFGVAKSLMIPEVITHIPILRK